MSGDKDKKECSLHNLLLISVIKQNRKFMKDFFLALKTGKMRYFIGLDGALSFYVLIIDETKNKISKFLLSNQNQ